MPRFRLSLCIPHVFPLVVGVFFGLAAGRGLPAQMWWEPPEKREGPVDKLKVDAAITLGVELIKSKQRPNGSFPGYEKGYPMGMTALCLLTMAKSGVQPSDPAVTKALDFLRYMPFRKTYSTGCLLMALETLHPRGAREWAAAGAKFLLETRQVDRGGTWGYPSDNYEETGNLGRPDLSNTQYAVLGLRSARRLGVKVPAEAFADVVRFLTKTQKDLGSFRYERPGQQGSGSMTTAALAIITIAEQAAGKSGAFSRVRADARAAFKKGMEWFEKNYTVQWNPRGDKGDRNKNNLAYYLYGIERFCDFMGLKKVGEHSWYDDGARFLLANQSDRGAWGRLENTCFALLFLSRASLSLDREIRTEAVAARRQELKARQRAWRSRVRPPQADKVPYVRDWLVLGPFRVKDDDALDPKAHPRPRSIKDGAQSQGKRWRIFEAENDAVDLEKILRGGDRRVAYVATHVHVPQAEKALLWLGTRDAWRVWVNGKEVGSRQVKAMNGADKWRVPCVLEKGINTVVLLLEDHAYEYKFWFRISDPEGFAVPGLLTAPVKSRLKKMAKRS